MNKAQLQRDIREERERLERALERLGSDVAIEPGVVGQWSVTSDHYREHRESLETWLAGSG